MKLSKLGDFSIVHVNGTEYFFNRLHDSEGNHPLSELLTYGSWVFIDENETTVSVDMSINPLNFEKVEGDIDLLGSDIACFKICGHAGVVEFDDFDDLFDGFDEAMDGGYES